MKKVFAAIGLTALGMLLAVLILPGWFGGDDAETRTYTVSEDFDSVIVRSTDCEVYISPGYDEQCRVYIHGSGMVEVEDGVLTVMQTKPRGWFEKLAFWRSDDSYITVYLPKITCGDIDVQTVSGDISVDSVKPETLTVKSTSGDVSLNTVRVSGAAEMTTVSGDIWFWEADAGTVQIKTVSGDVSGSFLTAKNFETHSVSGDIWMPRSDKNGGKCVIQTTSGDIWIDEYE